MIDNRTMQANEGRYLTQVDDVNDAERIYCKLVALGKGDYKKNWRDASEDEFLEWCERIEQLNEQLINEDYGQENEP